MRLTQLPSPVLSLVLIPFAPEQKPIPGLIPIALVLTANWTYTYTITPPTFTLPADGGSTVACIADAQIVPTPPAVNNSCGNAITITGPVIGADPVCSGTKTYTWTYTDCSGATANWTYTYTITPPTFTLPADGGSTVACIADAQIVPTPPAVNNSCGSRNYDHRSRHWC